MKTEQVKQSLHASDGGIVIPQQPFYKVLDGVCESLLCFFYLNATTDFASCQ